MPPDAMETSNGGPPEKKQQKKKKKLDVGAAVLVMMLPLAFIGLMVAGIYAIPRPATTPKPKATAAPVATPTPPAVHAEAGQAAGRARGEQDETLDD